MSHLKGDCVFISALNKDNLNELKTLLYNKVKEIHITRFPYNDFLFQHYTDEELLQHNHNLFVSCLLFVQCVCTRKRHRNH